MDTSFKFHRSYFFLTLILFTAEISIALFAHDRVIRPYVGDFLVVILIYCFFKSFIIISPVKLAVGVLLFAYMVEISQYFNLVGRLGLARSAIARIIMGSSFGWIDMITYTAGFVSILFIEKFIAGNSLTGNRNM